MNKTAVVAALVVAAVLGWHFGAQEKSVSADVAADSDGTKAAGVVELQDQVAATYEGSTDQVQGTQTGAMADPAADSKSTPVSAPRPMAARSFESHMLTNNMVNDTAMKALEVKDFDQLVNALDAENAGRYNPVAEKYRTEVQGTLEKVAKRSQIDRFACGANVCMASIRTPAGDSSFLDWYQSLQPNSTLPIGALAGYDVTLPGDVVEHRILFTTQPGSAGFIVRPVPQPPARQGR